MIRLTSTNCTGRSEAMVLCNASLQDDTFLARFTIFFYRSLRFLIVYIVVHFTNREFYSLVLMMYFSFRDPPLFSNLDLLIKCCWVCWWNPLQLRCSSRFFFFFSEVLCGSGLMICALGWLKCVPSISQVVVDTQICKSKSSPLAPRM